MSNSDRYKMTSTSRITSRIEDIELWRSENELTRRVIRAEVVENPRDRKKSIKFALVHQRRANTSQEWADLGGPGLNRLRAGDAVKMQLDTTQTRELVRHLLNLYEIGEGGVRRGTTVLEIANEDEVIRTDVNRARIIKKLLEGEHGEEIWNALVEEDPGLATKISLSRIYEERKEVIQEFEDNISKELGEEYWQKFFLKNHWIFGSSYIGRIGERRINIKSTLDHPLITEDGHLEIVEIKTPEFPFWKLQRDGSYFLYRKKYLVPHVELQCAITQGENYILETEKEMDSKAWAESHSGIYLIKPKCLIVHGRSNDWKGVESTAFRLLNDSLHGTTVITFDHLLLRARQMVELFNPKES
ncbi:MAG: Shedu anti-phage system protein SduA domain-containing protein [Patescibacteria group bacterium]|jgi:hypothetical protein